MGIEQTPEYIQSMNMRPACNRVLMKAFGIPEASIERFPHGDDLFILDQEFAIDVRLRLSHGLTVTGQEKALSHQFHRYRTFTVEFYQNRHTEELGELFKIASQFYLHGYSDATGREFIEWKIIDVFQLILWINSLESKYILPKVRGAQGSRASFLAIPYDDIPSEFILFEWSHPDRMFVHHGEFHLGLRQ